MILTWLFIQKPSWDHRRHTLRPIFHVSILILYPAAQSMRSCWNPSVFSSFLVGWKYNNFQFLQEDLEDSRGIPRVINNFSWNIPTQHSSSFNPKLQVVCNFRSLGNTMILPQWRSLATWNRCSKLRWLPWFFTVFRRSTQFATKICSLHSPQLPSNEVGGAESACRHGCTCQLRGASLGDSDLGEYHFDWIFSSFLRLKALPSLKLT